MQFFLCLHKVQSCLIIACPPSTNYRALQPTVSAEKIASAAILSSHRGGNNTLFAIFIDQSYLMSPIVLVHGLVTPMKIEGKSYALWSTLWAHSDDVALDIRSDDIANNAIRPMFIT